MLLRLSLCFLFALASAAGGSAQTLDGAIDLHIHSDPDSMPRALDGLDAARLAKQAGMRAIVLKNHYEPTASLAFLARKINPGIEVFGGIALNHAVGGINAAAVERMIRVKGGYGRIVWMPTFDAENNVRSDRQKRPFVPIAKDGKLLPAVLEVLDIIARSNLVLATGHSSPAENLTLIREARARGITRIIVTHATTGPVNMDLAAVKEAARMGAFLEFTYLALLGNEAKGMENYAAAIRAAGVDRSILVSDLGQAGNALPVQGLQDFFQKLRNAGFTAQEIEIMVKHNPAQLLGLR